jgi:DNA repair photolyase
MGGPADDGRHSVLRRARRVSQASIDSGAAEWAWRPPTDPGRYELLEVEAKSALTVLGLPGGGWSLNPYVGCNHACLYCYAPDVLRVERERWGRYVVAKRNVPTLLAHELKTKTKDDVFLSSATDPYQAAEGETQLTRRCLELLARADWPVGILTRSPLVTRDLDLLRRFSDVDVGLSVPTLDDDARRVLEPSAPPIEGRLRALGRLSDAGLPTRVSFAPAYPLTGGVTPAYAAERFRDAGARKVTAGAFRYMDSLRVPIRERLAGTGYEGIGGLLELASYTRHLFKRMRAECERVGIAFEVYDLDAALQPRPRAASPPGAAAVAA